MDELDIKCLILLRGLPGSGKRSLAEALSENGKYPVCAIDHYFTDESGNYNFRFAENHLAYEACIQHARSEIRKNTPKIFVDNTFTLDWEIEPYIKMAAESGYRLYIVTVENYHGEKNIHGITDDQLAKMAEKYKVKLF
jgi:predicted kinase